MNKERTMSYLASRKIATADLEQVNGGIGINLPSVIATYSGETGVDVRLD